MDDLKTYQLFEFAYVDREGRPATARLAASDARVARDALLEHFPVDVQHQVRQTRLGHAFVVPDDCPHPRWWRSHCAEMVCPNYAGKHGWPG